MTNKQELINLIYDGEVKIATGKSRMETNWTNKSILWSDLVKLFSETKYTSETFSEYIAMEKNKQGAIKDVGGFVGGTLRDGKRNKLSVVSRSVLTLDIDNGDVSIYDRIKGLYNFAWCIYSTHKHTKDKPRLRFVIPLNREVTSDEYEALGRRIALEVGLDYFDGTTYDPSRLMYWPSASKDGLVTFLFNDDPWIDVDNILKRYDDYKNISSWAHTDNLKINSKESPRNKKGIIGAFCRAYSIHDVIKEFLSDIYLPSRTDDRYTYKNGSTTCGLVVYENGDFAYSHHSTDPASGVCCNSFDLVRIHKFSTLDNDVSTNTKISKLPSFKSMVDFSMNDIKVKRILAEENFTRLTKDIDINNTSDTEWITQLELNPNGRYEQSIDNVVIILENDPNLKGKIAFNEFSNFTVLRGNIYWRDINICREGEQWKDSDDSSLRHYLEKIYKIKGPGIIYDALTIIAKKYSFHPVREYLNELKWDGIPRIETVFIDYLGADDSEYVRAVTRKSLVAAVARVFEPGIKFDNMVVLVGKQGVGKSHILNLLGQQWYSDSLTTVQGKEAYEQLQSNWIIEMSELSATKKAEEEAVKHFISKREDIFRVAYGKRTEKFPRQCVFFGTTNDHDFLRDKTGNRRFWPIVVGESKSIKNLWKDMNEEKVNQIWAEAVYLWSKNENLILDEDLLVKSIEEQDKHTQVSEKEGIIKEYLEMLLPEDWDNLSIQDRQSFIHYNEHNTKIGTVKREKVCSMEIWRELFRGEVKDMTPIKLREITEILRKLEGWKQHSTSSGRLRFGKLYGSQKAFVRDQNMKVI